MPEEELISKKDLLKLTGISYGQLYRWKRQNLIPEAWFIKQSAFTGQETFFPKDKIMQRIKTIMELKDQYSLEELADLLSPESTNRFFQADELKDIAQFSPQVLQIFAKSSEQLTFKELVLMYVLSTLNSQYVLKECELADMAISATRWLPDLKNIAYRFVACRREEQTFCLMVPQNVNFLLDYKTEQLAVFELEEVAKDLNLKLNQVLEGR